MVTRSIRSEVVMYGVRVGVDEDTPLSMIQETFRVVLKQNILVYSVVVFDYAKSKRRSRGGVSVCT